MAAKRKRTQTQTRKGRAAKSKSKARAAKSKLKARAAKSKSKSMSKSKSTSKSRRPSRKRRPAAGAITASKWVRLVEKHGVMLASARGVAPNVAEAVAGGPIIGGWWAHPKGKAIFAALSEIDDSDDVRCFRLIDGKITFAHRRVWPALVRLGRDGALAADQLAAVQQEHLPTGEHRNFITAFPEWVDDATAKSADRLTLAAARKLVAI